MDAILAAAAAEAAARNAADAAARNAAAAAAQAASDAAAAQAAAAKAAADAAAQQAAAVQDIVKEAAANNYFTAQEYQISPTLAQQKLDFYNAMASYPDVGILTAQENILYMEYVAMKYGVWVENEGYGYFDMNVSLSPELEAMEKLAFLMFKDAFTAITKGKWEAIVKAEEDAAQAAKNTTTTSGGGGGGYTAGGGGGGGTGGGFGGSGGGWYIWNPPPSSRGSVIVSNPVAIDEQGKEIVPKKK